MKCLISTTYFISIKVSINLAKKLEDYKIFKIYMGELFKCYKDYKYCKKY